MSDSVYSMVDKCCEAVKLDFSEEEFARLAADNAFSPESLTAVSTILEYLAEKEKQTTIQMLLWTSRLPQKNAKAFA